MLRDSHIQPVSVILQDFHGIPVVQGVNDAVVQALAGTDIQIGAVVLTVPIFFSSVVVVPYAMKRKSR